MDWTDTYKEYLEKYFPDVKDEQLQWAKETVEELEQYLPGIKGTLNKLSRDDMGFVDGMLITFEYYKEQRVEEKLEQWAKLTREIFYCEVDDPYELWRIVVENSITFHELLEFCELAGKASLVGKTKNLLEVMKKWSAQE